MVCAVKIALPDPCEIPLCIEMETSSSGVGVPKLLLLVELLKQMIQQKQHLLLMVHYKQMVVFQ